MTKEQLCLLPPDLPDPLDRGLLAYCRQHGIPAVLPDTIEAGDAWGANCGPMALAAVLDLPTVEAARPLVQPLGSGPGATAQETTLCEKVWRPMNKPARSASDRVCRARPRRTDPTSTMPRSNQVPLGIR